MNDERNQTMTDLPPRAIPRTKPNVNDRYRADTATPLATIGKVAPDELPTPPMDKAKAAPVRSITLTTEITYRDYEIKITATGYTLDQFCDMIDKRLGVVG
jgi:hypothetical protein